MFLWRASVRSWLIRGAVQVLEEIITSKWLINNIASWMNGSHRSNVSRTWCCLRETKREGSWLRHS